MLRTKSMSRPLTVRDLRLRWPEAERRLRREREIIVTRDGQPVAKLSAFRAEEAARPRWSAKRHLGWLERTWKGARPGPTTEELLARDRGE
jgi:antitoxin (DNA-binding transcriptional repressor) of toxin-antitoxin stability system